MRALLRRGCAGVTALVLAFTCGPSQGASKTGAQKPAEAKVVSAEVPSLRQAYALLSSADHDYQGHRARAMKLIEAACRALGSTVKGDGQGDEPQSQSDGQVQQALALLQSVKGAVSGNPRASHHVERAIKELDTALSIK